MADRDIEAERRSRAVDRFWSKVGASTSTGCREWQGYLLASGYGRIKFLGRTILAHRLAWELTHGAIPAVSGHHGTMSVCHRCDNPRCCNVDHLFLGTHADNMRDRDAKGRCRSAFPRVHGERTTSAKLTDAAVLEIRRLRNAGVSTTELARRFGVHSSVISRAARGATWSHLPKV